MDFIENKTFKNAIGGIGSLLRLTQSVPMRIVAESERRTKMVVPKCGN